jgi:dihydroorotase
MLIGLKRVFNITEHGIVEKNAADLTLFNPDKEWIFSKENIYSTSKNASLLGKKLQGKVYGTFSNNNLVI